MGRTPVRAADGIGFLANRAARPFSLEALRLLGERIAELDQIDRIVRIGGGYRMGPFELMDLIGIDVNLEVATSFCEQSFGEPRWRPHPLQQRMVDSGRLGRKAGARLVPLRRRPAPPRRPAPAPGPGLAAVAGPRGRGRRALGRPARSEARHRGRDRGAARRRPGRARRRRALLHGARKARRVHAGRRPGAGAGPDRLPARKRGLLRRRARGSASPDDLDTALRLGFNHPRGPFEWGREIGPANVLATLEALSAELGADRYRPAPLLRRWAAAGGRVPPH